MAPRSMWNGSLAVGEVIIPVKLFSVVQQHRVQFREVRLSDASRIRHQRMTESGEEIPSEELRKAYELDDGREIILTDEEIASTQSPRAKVIEIQDFVPAQQIDPVFYEKPYLLGAQAGGEHAYTVMAAALAETGKVGIGRFVLRTREQLVALAPHGEALRVYTMHFADELVSSADLDVPSMSRKASSKETDMAQRLIDALATEWEPERHEDHHRDAVMAVIKRKATGGTVQPPKASAPKPVPDLLAALTKSVEQSGGAQRTSSRRKAATSTAKAQAKPKAGAR